MKIILLAIVSAILTSCAYNSPGAHVNTSIPVTTSLIPPMDQQLSTNAR